MFVDRFMSTAMHYPCNYGYIPQTLSDDGDPVDVLVITPFPLMPGVVVTLPADRRAEDGRRGRRRRQAARGADRQDPADLHALAEAGGHATRCACSRSSTSSSTTRTSSPASGSRCSGWEGPDAARAEVSDGIARYARGQARAAAQRLTPRAASVRRARRGLERAALVQLVEVALDAGAFAREEVVDRARRTAGARSQCADQVCTGSRPRAILCSPCAPPSKRR